MAIQRLIGAFEIAEELRSTLGYVELSVDVERVGFQDDDFAVCQKYLRGARGWYHWCRSRRTESVDSRRCGPKKILIRHTGVDVLDYMAIQLFACLLRDGGQISLTGENGGSKWVNLGDVDAWVEDVRGSLTVVSRERDQIWAYKLDGDET